MHLGEIGAKKIVEVPARHEIFFVHRLVVLRMHAGRGSRFGSQIVFRQAFLEQREGLLG